MVPSSQKKKKKKMALIVDLCEKKNVTLITNIISIVVKNV